MVVTLSLADALMKEAPLAARSEDETAPLARLIELELDRSYRIAGLILGNGADAEEAAARSVEHAWERRSQLRDLTRFRAWFDRILVNECRDHIRRRGRVRFVQLENAGELPIDPDAFEALADRDEVLRAMAALEVDERAVIVLHYWADLTLRDVADHLGWRTGTVKSRLHRALAKLRQQMATTESHR
jgi:RNA polymerase sigma-70 factor (ECF subfamily)